MKKLYRWRMRGWEIILTAMLGLSPLGLWAGETYPKGLLGFWQGDIEAAKLRIVLHLTKNKDHSLGATLDSPDQNIKGIPVNQVTYGEGHLHLEVSAVNGSFDGHLTVDGSEIDGTWNQGRALALNLKKTLRQPDLGPSRLWGTGPLESQYGENFLVRIIGSQGEVASVTSLVFTEGWKFHNFQEASPEPRFDRIALLPDGSRLGLKYDVQELTSGIHVQVTLTALESVKLIAARVNVDFPYADWMQSPYQLGLTKGRISPDPSTQIVFATGDSAELSLGPAPQCSGLSAKMTAPELNMLLQDSRQWGGKLSVILSHAEPGDKPWIWNAGEQKKFDFTLTFNRSLENPAVWNGQNRKKDLEGYWFGKMPGIQNESRLDRCVLRFEKGEAGKWIVYGQDLDLYGGGKDEILEKVRWKKPYFSGQNRDVVLNLKLNRTGDILDGSLQTVQKTNPIQFRRGLAFILPRVDREGMPVTHYDYQMPQTLTDGWTVGDLRKSPLDPERVSRGIDKILNRRFPNIEGLVVVQKGRLLLDEYFKGLGPGDSHQLQSVTKSVLSILFGIAQDRGLVATEDKLFDYFPEYRSQPGWKENKNQITLGNLLSMSSGLACDDWLPPGDNCNSEMWRSQDWLSYILTLPLDHSPGEHFAYSTSCMEPLGAILARKSGMTVPQFAQRVLYDPLGIEAHQWASGPNQVTEVGGSHCLRPRDMAKLGYLYLNKGRWNGKQIVSQRWVEESTSPKVPNPKDKPRYFEYGYLWWQEQMSYQNRKTKVFYAAGRGGQYIFVVPELDLVCAITAANYDESPLSSEDFFKSYILGSYKG